MSNEGSRLLLPVSAGTDIESQGHVLSHRATVLVDSFLTQYAAHGRGGVPYQDIPRVYDGRIDQLDQVAQVTAAEVKWLHEHVLRADQAPDPLQAPNSIYLELVDYAAARTAESQSASASAADIDMRQVISSRSMANHEPAMERMRDVLGIEASLQTSLVLWERLHGPHVLLQRLRRWCLLPMVPTLILAIVVCSVTHDAFGGGGTVTALDTAVALVLVFGFSLYALVLVCFDMICCGCQEHAHETFKAMAAIFNVVACAGAPVVLYYDEALSTTVVLMTLFAWLTTMCNVGELVVRHCCVRRRLPKSLLLIRGLFQPLVESSA